MDQGKEKGNTIRMEVVCDADLWIWSLYAGLPGMLNDLNILQSSPLFAHMQAGQYSPNDVSILIGTYTLRWFYFFTDSIYPSWKIFVKTFSVPTTAKHQAFAKPEEGVRNCVKRVFWVLFQQFPIIQRRARGWSVSDCVQILTCCTILHNMTV